MNVDRMRAIDHWVGVPLCFVATLLVRLFGHRAPVGTKPRRILFIELSEMGSTILADPAMRKARQAFGAELYFAIFRRNAASLGFLETIPPVNIFTLRADSLVTLALDTLRFLAWTRRQHIDAVIDLELFSRFTALLTGLSGAGARIGFHRFHNEGLYRGEMLTHRVAYNPHIHIAKNFIALVNALACPVIETPYSKTIIDDSELTLPRLIPGERETKDLERRIAQAWPAFRSDEHRVVLINPNASELLPQRRWPPEHFAELARAVLDRWSDTVILITGAANEDCEAERLKTRIGGERVVNFAGKVTLKELPVLYSLSSVMVTNDSGPGHFSAVTDMPTIVLFGPETPALYGSLGNSLALTAGLACSPCVSASNHRKTACRDPLCLKAIPPARVLAAVAEILDGGAFAARRTGGEAAARD